MTIFAFFLTLLISMTINLKITCFSTVHAATVFTKSHFSSKVTKHSQSHALLYTFTMKILYIEVVLISEVKGVNKD